jgi:hypothetical protein
MDRFEHLSMVVFLILGIGLVKLMTSFGAVMSRNLTARAEGREPARFYWVHSLFMGMVFTGMIVFWWNAYPLNDTAFMPDDEWNLFIYLLFLCSPMAYFLVSDVLMPKDAGAGGLSLRDYYYKNSTLLIGLCLLLQVLSLVNLLVFFNDVITSSRCLGRVALIVMLTPLMFSKKEALHKTVMCVFFLGFLYSLFKYHTHV